MTSQPLVAPKTLDAYRRDGAVCLPQCFSEAWVDVLNRGVDRNIANPGECFSVFSSATDAARAIADDWCWERIPEYQEFFRSSPAAQIAGELMGAQEVRFLEDQYFQKDAGSSTPTPWHQDQPYYDIEGRWCVMWIPLDAVAETDSLRFVPGSHLWGRLFHPTNFSTTGSGLYARTAASSNLEPMIDVDSDPEKYPTVAWAVQPGDCVVFHPCTIHGNRGNHSTGRARRLSLRWTAEDVVYVAGARPWPGLPRDHGLRDGHRIHGSKFPLVWTRANGLVQAPSAVQSGTD